jgi:hypothetical protein
MITAIIYFIFAFLFGYFLLFLTSQEINNLPLPEHKLFMCGMVSIAALYWPISFIAFLYLFFTIEINNA